MDTGFDGVQGTREADRYFSHRKQVDRDREMELIKKENLELRDKLEKQTKENNGNSKI